MKRARKGYRTPRVGEGQAELDFRSDPAGSERGEGWIGALPTLKSVPLKFLSTKIGSGKTPSGGSQAYVEDGIIFLRSQNVHFDGLRLEDVACITEETDAEMASTRIKSLDVVLNITGASIGRCSLIPDGFPPANVNQHVCIIRTEKAKLRPAYLNFVLQSLEIQTAIFSGENGSSREGLTFEQIGNFSVVSPPVEFQDAIAAYLARETGRIDGLIRAKEGLLGLLAEKRRALIARAVTRGLDPAAPLRDSGIPWLGAVPEHWEVKRLKWLLKAIEQGWSPQADMVEADDENWAVIKLSAIKQGKFFPRENKALPISYDIPFSLELRSGDFLITRSNTPSLVGDVCVVEETRPKLIFSDLVFRLQFDQGKIDPVFLKLILTTPIGRIQIEGDARGSSMSMVKISQEHVPNWRVPVPPLAEQRAIVAHVAAETAKLDALRASAERTIALLKERRAALISAAVTGRIEIPN